MSAADSLRFGGALFVEIAYAAQMDIYLKIAFLYEGKDMHAEGREDAKDQRHA